MKEIKFRLRIGDEIIGYERWYKGDGSNAHWEHLKKGETIWYPAFLYATDRNLFTNLLDKNGKEIYEGDIIDISRDYYIGHVVVEFGSYKSDESGETIGNGWFVRYGDKDEPLHKDLEIKLIGNIYENNELLKENKV